MRSRQSSGSRVHGGLLVVACLALVAAVYGQAARTAGRASTAAELKKLAADVRVLSIVLQKDIVLDQSLVLKRTRPLSITARSKAVVANISCDRIGDVPAIVVETSSPIMLTNVNFTNCATGLQVDSRGLYTPHVTLDTVGFTGSSVKEGGFIVWQVTSGSSVLELRNTRVYQARARRGAVLWAHGGGNITITDSIFTLNTASEMGGALLVGPQVQLVVRSCEFLNNSAPFGGAVALGAQLNPELRSTLEAQAVAPASAFHVTSSRFVGNQARSEGGAIWCSHCTALTVAGAWFEANRAAGGQEAETLGGAVAVVGNRTKVELLGAHFLGNSAGFGGAVFLNNSCSGNSSTGCPVQLRAASASRNTATQDGHFLYTMDPAPVALCCGGIAPCPSQDPSGCTITDDTGTDLAPVAAGGSGPEGSAAEGSIDAASGDVLPGAILPSNGTPGTGVGEGGGADGEGGGYGEGGTGGAGGSGGVGGAGGAGSSGWPAAVVAYPPAGVKVLSAELLDSTLSVKAALVGLDGLVPGKGVPLPADVQLSLGLTDKRSGAMVLGGVTNITTDTTLVTWPPLQILPPPNSNVELVVNVTGGVLGSTVLSSRATVVVPACQLGSFNDTSKGVCGSCAVFNTFSLNTSVPCSNCFNGAVCQRGFLLPRTNYWMNGMLMPQLQWCPLDGACNGPDRLQRLVTTTSAFQAALAADPQAAWSSVSSHNTTYMANQCTPGYKGRFCGQCSKGYGLSGRKCVPCQGGRAGTTMLFLLCMLFLVGVVSVTLVTHLKATKLLALDDVGAMVGGRGGGGVSHGALQHDLHSDLHDGSPWHGGDEEGQRPHLFDLALVLDNAHKLRQAANVRTSRTGPISTPVHGRNPSVDGEWEHHQAAQYFLLTAMIKILVTYVQLVGMLPGLKLRWPAELRRVLFFMDFTSSAGWLPLGCAIGGSEKNKAIATTLLYVVVFPVCVIILALLLWLVVLKNVLKYSRSGDADSPSQGLAGRKSQGSSEPTIVFHAGLEMGPSYATKKRCTAVLVQCLYYLYPFVTLRIMQVFSCMQVGTMSRALWAQYVDKVPAGTAQVAPGFYWIQSSAVRCFSDPAHRALAISLAVLGGSVWVFGVPLLMLWGAYRNRHSARLQAGAISWGFVYLEYKPEFWFWEFVVCWRKLCVMGCTQLLVFGRGPLSAGQVYATMVFVVFGWLLHEVWRPFSDQVLISMDRCSSFGVIVALIVIAFKLNAQNDTAIDVPLMVAVSLLLLSALAFLLAKLGVQVYRLCRGRDASQEQEAGMKDGRGSAEGAHKHVIEAQMTGHGQSDWFGSAVESALDRFAGVFNRQRNPLNDVAKRAWTRPSLTHASSLEREIKAASAQRR